jgi:plasmid stability protein
MESLTLTKLEGDLVSRLRSRAKAHGNSIEEEAAIILRDALPPKAPPVQENAGQKLIDAIREAFGPLGGVDLELPPRQNDWKPPVFD